MVRKRSSYFAQEERSESYWPSFTDMMSTIVLVMLFIALVAFIQSIYDAYDQQEIRREMAQIASVKKHVSQLIEQELETRVGQEQVVQGPNNTISIEGDILFETGSTEISAEGQEILRHLADAFQQILQTEELSQYLYIILIEGHTDQVPYDNWSLSSERAVEVVKYMLEINDILAQNDYAKYFAATGYSEFHPVAEGDDQESLRKNRRISFQIIVDDDTWQSHMYELMERSIPLEQRTGQ